MPNCHCSRCDRDRITLGLEEFAPFEEVSRSYKELVRVWHPDRFESDSRLRLRAEEQFKLVQQAFTALKDHELLTPVAEPVPEPTQARPSPPAPTLNDALFFPVSLLKLFVMNSCTFGMYQVYWFYKNWAAIRRSAGVSISPFWRAIIPVFYCYRCFTLIGIESKARGLKTPPTKLLGIAWTICAIALRLPGYWPCLSLLCPLFMLPIQACVNRINLDALPMTPRNSRFSLWNWLAVLGGGACIALIFIGTLFPSK